MKAAVKFETVLKDHLSDPEQAAKYLTACFEEGPEVFLQALRDVVDAQGGMSRTAITGVHAVLTADDVPVNRYGLEHRDQPVLACDIALLSNST